MRVYIRKIMEHDMTHEVSITQYVYHAFFEGKGFVSFQIKGEGYMYNVTFNDATDLRFGADFKMMCRILDVKEGDYLIIQKKDDNLFSINVDKKEFAKNKPYIAYFTGTRRHLIAATNGTFVNKEYVR